MVVSLQAIFDGSHVVVTELGYNSFAPRCVPILHVGLPLLVGVILSSRASRSTPWERFLPFEVRSLWIPPLVISPVEVPEHVELSGKVLVARRTELTVLVLRPVLSGSPVGVGCAGHFRGIVKQLLVLRASLPQLSILRQYIRKVISNNSGHHLLRKHIGELAI